MGEMENVGVDIVESLESGDVLAYISIKCHSFVSGHTLVCPCSSAFLLWLGIKYYG